MAASLRGADGLKRSKSDEASTLPGYPQSCAEAAIPATKTSVVQRIHDVASTVYQKAIVEAILRRGELAASKDGRHIPLRLESDEPLIDTRRGQAYISNSIRTSRYTLWNFIPKQLFFQFTRVGNFYFLCVGIPQMIPGLSTTGSYTTILPLLFFVCLTMFKEGYDDYRRHRLDKVENANFATILGKEDQYAARAARPARFIDRFNPFHATTTNEPRPVPADEFEGVRWVPTRWANIKVGDVIRLTRDEPVPADIALLYSDGENNLAYVDTMALDGETNLKSKQVCHAIEGCDTIEGIAKCAAEFVAEDPNPDLFNFNGKVTVNGKTLPLTLNEIVYRGSVLRNTTCAIGIVINTGEECKVRMNSNRHPKAKKPALEKVVNRIVITLAFYVIILSVGVSMGYVRWQKSTERHSWYLNHASVPFHEIIIAFIIMFNNVIPLSLYVSLEIVKIGQLLLLNSDIDMYDEESDTPARCNTNTILENLGQVGYIFSDKTGTLTDNVMKFRKISVAGTVWLHEMDLDPQPQPDGSDSVSSIVKEVEFPSRAPSVYRRDRLSVVIHEDRPETLDSPMSPRQSMAGRRSSSQWRSTGRPDHVQPDVNTSDLLEYMKQRPHSAFTRKTKEYLLAMALCHSCLPEHKDGKLDFQASSPDELALVRAAQEMGYLVVQRNSKQITLQVTQADGTVESLNYDILDIIEFSSARKRMSIVVRYPDGRISVICKGADSAILPRLRLSSLAMQKATEVRQSADLEHEMFRRSEQLEPRNSFGGRPSLSIRRNPTITRERSVHRQSMGNRSRSFELNKLTRRSEDRPRLTVNTRGVSFDIANRPYLSPMSPHAPAPLDPRLTFLEDSGIFDESEVFTKCFKHLDDFATEGLRTLLFAQKFVSESEYRSWKKLYDDATTSLTNRQDKIEAAGEMIEQSFELVGGSAIEDKLQKGVPETIDRLRRANIKIWMLTGDKRETAINIAHSARICRPGSDLYILDITKGSLETQLSAMAEDLHAGSIHSVVVIDGQTLAAVEKSDALSVQFFAIMLLVDSVICCRASPAQKALLVRTVRSKLKAYRGEKRRGLTLAIGDGANDLAMIQASHVGIGISGKEGLQAARVADYAIAQFRFLQRLLLVHGRWNYVRTAKFIVCTFWKEMFFYLPAAQYQRYNGYTGTSLYQSASLTVFNTLFTSLCTICMGIWEQDLSAETLLAIPELYVYGQRNMGLNFWKYMRWMVLAAIEGVITWNGIWAGYGWVSPAAKDENLYAIGSLVFTVGVLWINWKLFIFETHYKSAVVMACFFVTTFGWFAWLAFLDGVYGATPSGVYDIRRTFSKLWGGDAVWWSTAFIVLSFMGMIELLFKALKRGMLVAGLWHWPPWQKKRLGENVEEWDLELWQEMEQDPTVKRKLAKMARDHDDLDIEEDDEEEDIMEQIEIDISAGRR